LFAMERFCLDAGGEEGEIKEERVDDQIIY
jgi:hypothetical protein